jgi:hypothetical protein
VRVFDGSAGDPRELLGVEQQLQHVRRLWHSRASFVSTGS